MYSPVCGCGSEIRVAFTASTTDAANIHSAVLTSPWRMELFLLLQLRSRVDIVDLLVTIIDVAPLSRHIFFDFTQRRCRRRYWLFLRPKKRCSYGIIREKPIVCFALGEWHVSVGFSPFKDRPLTSQSSNRKSTGRWSDRKPPANVWNRNERKIGLMCNSRVWNYLDIRKYKSRQNMFIDCIFYLSAHCARVYVHRYIWWFPEIV